MSLFGLDWFISERTKEQQKLKNEELALKNEFLKMQIAKEKKAGIIPASLYKSIKLIGDTLTVILPDGAILSKTEATVEDFKKITTAVSLDDILFVIGSPSSIVERIKEKEENKKIVQAGKGLHVLKGYKDFKIKGKSVFLKTSNRSLPPLLVARFVEIIERCPAKNSIANNEKLLEKSDEYQGLKNFFLWACLNPRAEVASDLYDFLDRNSFRITKQGFFVALRNVVTVTSEDTLVVQFISNAYNKVKAVWKKSVNDYSVVEERKNTYKLIKTGDSYSGELLGTLKDLYLSLPDMKENRFTDAHTKTFDIRVGKVVNMPMEECSWSRRDCMEAGLHFTSDEIHYVGCGDTSVLILINPMKVVGIGTSKGRCYEYLPIMTVPRDEATKILHDINFNTLELDEDYAIKELAKLTEIATAGFTAEITKNQFNMPAISNIEMTNIVASLNSMKKTLKKRVSIIK